MFVFVAVAIGATIGLLVGRMLAAPKVAPPVEVYEPVEPFHALTFEELEHVLAPYERAA